jgi:hypothetical protein
VRRVCVFVSTESEEVRVEVTFSVSRRKQKSRRREESRREESRREDLNEGTRSFLN